MANFYYQHDGKVIGPLTGIDLREAAFAGKVVPTTFVSDDKSMAWVPASQVRGLFDEGGAPLPHPPETEAYLNKASSTKGVVLQDQSHWDLWPPVRKEQVRAFKPRNSKSESGDQALPQMPVFAGTEGMSHPMLQGGEFHSSASNTFVLPTATSAQGPQYAPLSITPAPVPSTAATVDRTVYVRPCIPLRRRSSIGNWLVVVTVAGVTLISVGVWLIQHDNLQQLKKRPIPTLKVAHSSDGSEDSFQPINNIPREPQSSQSRATRPVDQRRNPDSSAASRPKQHRNSTDKVHPDHDVSTYHQLSDLALARATRAIFDANYSKVTPYEQYTILKDLAVLQARTSGDAYDARHAIMRISEMRGIPKNSMFDWCDVAEAAVACELADNGAPAKARRLVPALRSRANKLKVLARTMTAFHLTGQQDDADAVEIDAWKLWHSPANEDVSSLAEVQQHERTQCFREMFFGLVSIGKADLALSLVEDPGRVEPAEIVVLAKHGKLNEALALLLKSDIPPAARGWAVSVLASQLDHLGREREADELISLVQPEVMQVQVLGDVATEISRAGKTERASELLRRAETIVMTTNRQARHTLLLSQLVTAEADAGFIEQAAQRDMTSRNPGDEARALIALARAYTKASDFKSAWRAVLNAQRRLGYSNDKELVREKMREIGKLHCAVQEHPGGVYSWLDILQIGGHDSLSEAYFLMGIVDAVHDSSFVFHPVAVDAGWVR